MTNSEVDGLKTSEFLRRRKLRLQQVREQSKDIAKKIRQRAKVENLRQVIELDSKKKNEYLQRQEQLVKKLEEYYAAGLENVGSSHKIASEARLQGADGDKVDLSKKRGREAAAELRKKRQQILDKQKELLDRKLQAREVANEISRDKSGAVLNKVLAKPSSTAVEETQSKSSVLESDVVGNAKKDNDVARSDMATQWDLDEMPNEWEPNIPTLVLPKDDNSVKEFNNNVDSKSDKSKRFDLFAVSEEMPSSLCGNLTNQERVPVKSSLTLVSEYLQNRDLRLRETDTNRTNKKMEDIQSLKQTILRTRTSKEGTVSACHVHDREMVPVPTWQAENANCEFCDRYVVLHKNYKKTLSTTPMMDLTCSNSLKQWSTFRKQPKTMSSSLKSCKVHSPVFDTKRYANPDILPSPVLRGTSPFRRTKVASRSFAGKGEPIEKQLKSSKFAEDSAAPKKSLVTMYNHVTRDSRDIPLSEQSLVTRKSQDATDAYSQAMKESSPSRLDNKEHQKKLQEIRSKVAMTKQNVEKEYRDTISFLNALPKDKGNKPNKTAYMDEQRQQMQKDMRQQKLQQEYRKIEKECSKHTCKTIPKSKSRSPEKSNSDVFESTDMQYSWMPVPESDGNLVIHTIPTTVREGKNNTVKFSKVDSYHEYRSRHKHTPPTKETAENPRNVNTLDSFDVQNSSDSESLSSSSSVQSVRLKKREKPLEKKELSDAERIIIYKVLDTNAEERKSTSKLIRNIAKSLTRIEQNTKTDSEIKNDAKKSNINDNPDNIVAFEQLNEGVYEAVHKNGDNIASMYFHDKDAKPTEIKNATVCARCKKRYKQPRKSVVPQQWEANDEIQERPRSPRATGCHCNCNLDSLKSKSSPVGQPSMSTSATSFLTATNDKANTATSDKGYIKLVDGGGREAGKFYIGASGLLNDDAYEVVIQVRKKGDEKESTKKTEALGVDRVTVVSTTQTSLKDILDENQNKTESSTASALAEPQESKAHDSLRSEASTVKSSQRIKSSDVIPHPKEDAMASEQVDSKEDEPTVCGKIQTQTDPEVPSASAPRPATSASTQTNLNSPSHRPVLFHMSSSTSTAYMSPPEMIIPKFLRQGYQITDEDMYDPKNYAVGEIITEQLHEYSEEVDCECRKCMHARRLTLTNRVCAPERRCKSARKPRAPPNTAGTTARSEIIDHIYFNEVHENDAVDDNEKQTKCMCRKCTRSIHEHKNSRHSAPSKISSRNTITRVPSSSVSKRGQMAFKSSKTSLKPVIKNYVDKLLELNKESLKAVQVVDQDCSSITTPGSSIINIPNNIDKQKLNLGNKLSLEKLRDILKQKIIDENEKKTGDGSNQNSQMCYTVKSSKKLPKTHRKRTAHKVKSLNISKKMPREQTSRDSQINIIMPAYSSTRKEQLSSTSSKIKIRSKSIPTPRLPPNSDTTDKSENSDLPHLKLNIPKFSKPTKVNEQKTTKETLQISGSSNHAMTTTSNDSERHPLSFKTNTEVPMSISTQTSINVDSEVNFMKLAEDKLQNMEKIADLTEKCTKRLSNLAKVLEEVRKNKTLVYSHISTSDATSDSDQNSEKNEHNVPPSREPPNAATQKSEQSSPDFIQNNILREDDNSLNSTDYVPVLSNIPKPAEFKNHSSDLGMNLSSSSLRKSNSSSLVQNNVEQPNKARGKPPPALSRLHLKHGPDFVVPHELSTVVEVDSPMSVKLKSSRNDTRTDAPETSNNRSNGVRNEHYQSTFVELSELQMGDANNPDLLDVNEVSNEQHKDSKVKWSDNSKVQMIDIEQFNEIMLKPFFSLQEYAKQCNVGALDDGSNLDDVLKDDHINDELSSLHSEASLPDVISELLKRNIISEPFKFDSGSNANSTTVSSESTISMLALSRARQGANKSSIFKNRDIGETSDTLSISSNPDLENAFKKLGMGWASSTLKKTKERLALSSSSNTSSSSLAQFRAKDFNRDVEPATDTISSIPSLPKKLQQRNSADISKNAEQQTSTTNAMTVKEFLTNELAKKITFNNKSKNDTADEFVSLYETKLPEEMKHSSLMVREEGHSIDNSMYSGNNNRARTSTPVQLYKSVTYHTSSSSNISNGLFSNADDLSSVKVTSNSMKHSTSDRDDLIIPNFSLRMKKCSSDCSKSD